MEYVLRDLEKQLQKYLTLPHIIAIVGPRRSGKTTLLRHLQAQLENSIYLSFEDQKVLELFHQDIDGFVELYVKNNQTIFIDEFHYATEGGKQLKYLFDFFPEKKVIISGSSSLDLMVKAVKHLVGRIIHFELFPFSFREFLRAKSPELLSILENGRLKDESPLHQRIFKLWQEYLIFGGYPEVVLQSDREIKIKLLEGIYNTYLLRELRDIIRLSNDFKFVKLLKALALQMGNLINYNELSELSGYDYKTLKARLNILEKTYLTSFIYPFYRNKRTEIVKNPKVYFLDSGLRNCILSNFQTLDLRSDSGALCENYVFTALKRTNLNVNFWRTKNKTEIDFIIQKNGDLWPVEVKCSENVRKMPRAFHSFKLHYDFSRGIVFSLMPRTKKEPLNHTTNVNFLPIYCVEFEEGFNELNMHD
ncbi:ATP-binding protein [Calditrichota bacterium LG25]